MNSTHDANVKAMAGLHSIFAALTPEKQKELAEQGRLVNVSMRKGAAALNVLSALAQSIRDVPEDERGPEDRAMLVVIEAILAGR